MSKHKMEDGTVVDTDRAVAVWEEDTYHDGRNRVSRATGDQFHHQTLYQSRKGRYYIVHHSNWQGSRDHAEWVSPREAVRWLLVNDGEVPENLKNLVEQVSE